MIRRLSIAATAVLMLMLMAAPVRAKQTPTDTIRQTVNEILDIVKNPEIHDPAKRPALLKAIEDKVTTIFDFTEFSARTVGPKWRQFTDDQKKRFVDAFSSLLRATYIEKVDGYDGEQVNYIGEISNAKGDKAEVQTTLRMKEKEVPVSYRLLDKDGVWKIYDVRIEKVSLIENYRGQFKEILLKGDPEELIGKVEAKAEEIRRQNRTAKKE